MQATVSVPRDARWSDLHAREFGRILLIKLSAVGDVIHTLPVLTKLRQGMDDVSHRRELDEQDASKLSATQVAPASVPRNRNRGLH